MARVLIILATVEGQTARMATYCASASQLRSFGGQDSFLKQTRWQPPQTAMFAGALCYSRYGRFKRFLVLLFVRMAGGDTDTSRDYEYTDWEAVDRFAVDFSEHLGLASAQMSDKTKTVMLELPIWTPQ